MTDNSEGNVQDELQKLMALVSNRSAGLSNDDMIENAISSLLHKNSDMISKQKPRSNQPVIEEDDEDYDNIEEQDLYKKPDDSLQQHAKPARVSIQSLQEQEKKLHQKLNLPEFLPEWNNLESIPLGRTGAKIHITFGDGTQPLPETIALTLLATRNCLQTAIQDARALRRQLVREYQKAKTIVHLSNASKSDRESLAGKGNMADSIDLDMYFRAIEGTDSLRKELKVGFDVLSLEKLFPEEMYAYQRWNKMHDAYEKSKNDKKEEEEGDHEDIKEQLKQQELEKGGSMQERLANFDQRTARMKQNWYLAFSEVRQGSFLSKVGMNSEAQAWEKERAKTSGRGKRREATWEALPASHVQFLHWVGFDQRSALPPPDVATTEALAFLGYNFMGKLVEKAIFIRRSEQLELVRNQRQPNLLDNEFILELPANEQLTKEDVEKALLDSTIVPKPLYNSANSVLDSTEAAQIYFGPGFEDRIEMEMEQIFMKKKETSLSQQEVEIRKQEDELFEKLKSEPPTVLEGVMDILNDEEKTNEIAEMRSNDQRRRAEKDKRTKNKLQEAMCNDTLPVKRGRGRPRKERKEEQKVKRKRGRPSKAQKLREAKEAAMKARGSENSDSDSDSDYCE